MRGKHEIDMTVGSLPPKIIKFAIPFMLSAMLQTMFNAADNAVIGAFDGSNALAAVGSTGSITSFAVNLFLGLSVGTNALLAAAIGSGSKKACHDTVHTAVAMSLIIGIVTGAVLFIFTGSFLQMLNCPAEVFELAKIYLRIYFLGMPALSAYNFGAAILRSKGDTQRPLVYLMIAGVVNVLLNLVLVIVFKMSTAGVGIATTVSQYLSAYLTIRALTKDDDDCRLYLKKLSCNTAVALKILKIGVPASIQGLMFSISNITIQGSVNTFGADAMAGVGAGSSLNAIVYNSVSAFGHAALAFTGQNYGAKKFDRIKKVFLWCNVLMLCSWAIVTIIIRLNTESILRIFLPDNENALAYSRLSTLALSLTYFIAGFMEVSVGMSRGLGHSTTPAVMSVFGICGIRLLWLATVFKKYHTFICLYISYPVTWTITTLGVTIYFVLVYKKLLKHHN